MNKEFVKQEIKSLMEVIQEQQALLLEHQGKIPQIEFDILMGNFRKAYELFGELNKSEKIIRPVVPPPVESFQSDELIAETIIPVIEEKTIVPQNSEMTFHTDELLAVVAMPVIEEEKLIVQEVFTETPIIENKVEEIIESAPNAQAHVQPELIIANVETEVEVIEKEPISEAAIPAAALTRERTREFTKPTTKVAATASLFDDTPTVGGLFHGSTTVRDKIASNKEDKSVAEKLQQHPVSDLKKSIGINEKFSFINELFDGDLEAYNSAIDRLNSCKNYSDASEILSNDLATKHNWSPDGESFIQLNNLLERRFSS